MFSVTVYSKPNQDLQLHDITMLALRVDVFQNCGPLQTGQQVTGWRRRRGGWRRRGRGKKRKGGGMSSLHNNTGSWTCPGLAPSECPAPCRASYSTVRNRTRRMRTISWASAFAQSCRTTPRTTLGTGTVVVAVLLAVTAQGESDFFSLLLLEVQPHKSLTTSPARHPTPTTPLPPPRTLCPSTGSV